MADSFWTGGPAAYKRGLRQHHDAALRDLRERLSCCSNNVQRVELESEINLTERQLREKLSEIDKLLF